MEIALLISARNAHEKASTAEKTFEVGSKGVEHYWQLQPFVSVDRCKPPQSCHSRD